MLKAQYQKRGPQPAELIEAVALELPAVPAGQVRARVLAAPVNPSDLLTLTGVYGILPPLPAIGGNEGVGRVELIGEGVSHLQVGQLVLLPIGGGTWASHMQAPARQFIALPEGDPQQLAMLAINPPTAALLLRQIELQSGDWVIQNAANSGVGHYLIQLAKQRGLRTLNVVRRESAIAELKALGADAVLIDGPDLARQVRELIGDAPLKLAIDAIGGSASGRLAACLSDGGSLINYGVMSGQACELSPTELIFRDISLRGFWVARWLEQASPAEQAALYGELAGLIASGQLSTPIAACYPLTEVREALTAAAAGGRSGKILITP